MTEISEHHLLARQFWNGLHRIADPSTLEEIPAADQVETLQLIAIEAMSKAPTPETISWGSAAAIDVLAERRRQVEAEDFRFDEDDHYTSGEMAWAATCYLQNAAVAGKMQGLGLLTASECDERGKSLPRPEAWPWDAEWWKPSGQRRDLVKAAALIIAEIERLDRSTATEPRQ